MRIHEDAGRSVWNYSARIFSDGDHGGLHVDVGVHESRSYILIRCVYYLCVFTYAV